MTVYAIIMGISLVITTILLIYLIRKKPQNQMQQIFAVDIILLFILCLFVLLQILFSERLGIDPIYFDYFAYIGGCFLPVTMYFTALVFANTKIKFKNSYLLLFIIPTLSLILLWTNNLHHLFFVKYSIYMKDGIFGPFAYVHTFYSYLMLFIAIFYFIKYSIKNSGFFSKQSLLILLGTIVPVIINVLGTFGIIDITIYVTPITFLFAILFYALAIFKFQFLTVSPIALQKIVDRISDGYMVLNDEDRIIDFNQTFIDMFRLKSEKLRNVSIDELLKSSDEFEDDNQLFQKTIEASKTTDNTLYINKHFKQINKYFNIEINNIKDKNTYLGTLVLFKDVTQHNLDMQTIKNNQEKLMEKERLASLGQLIGGIAHNLKTPIMSISGAAEGLTDLVHEYDSSIGDPEVTNQDHHDIAKDMSSWIEKIKEYTEYMSDVITAVKGQAVTLSEEQETNFTVDELIKRVDILMKHELKNALIDLNINMNHNESTELYGNVNSLVQVINNMISNSIQSYEGKPNQKIDLSITKKDSNLIISIQDYGSGMSKEVKDKLFKEMITTKGKNGTGLGLFMSYSNIRAHFNGNITVESEPQKGTKFNIILPYIK